MGTEALPGGVPPPWETQSRAEWKDRTCTEEAGQAEELEEGSPEWKQQCMDNALPQWVSEENLTIHLTVLDNLLIFMPGAVNAIHYLRKERWSLPTQGYILVEETGINKIIHK